MVVLLTLHGTSYAGNYTWTGSAGKNWDTPNNWSPSGVPTTTDTVTIGSGSDTILINANTTINRLVMNGRVINNGVYQLEITQRASLNGGKIFNGTLKLRGVFAFFQGTNTNCTIDCVVNQIKFSGGTFDAAGTFEQNGTINGWGEGGSVFNAPVTIRKSGTATLRMGQTNPDTFNAKATFICSNSGNLEISHGSTTVFRDSVFLNTSHSAAHISFCNNTPQVLLEGEAVLMTGPTGMTNGRLTLKGIHQTSIKGHVLTGSGNMLINADSCRLSGALNITAPSILIRNNIFYQSVSLIKTAAATNSYSYGNNIFHGVTTIENQDGTRALRLANEMGDTYHGDVSFIAGTNNVQVGYKGHNTFSGNITINNNKVVFNASTGKIILSGHQTQTLGGGATYVVGKLEINKDGGTVLLNRAMTIDSTITFVNGIINTDSVITLKAGVNCSGASNQSFVDGPVRKIGNQSFKFPIGSDLHYYPLQISAPAANTDSYTARYHYQTPADQDSLDSLISYISSCQYWNITRNTGNSSISVELFWDSLGCGVYDSTDLVVANYTNGKWVSLGKNQLDGNASFGSILSATNVLSYGSLTLARRGPPPVITAQLKTLLQRSMPEDVFGYNGSNTIQSDQSGIPKNSWEKMADHDNNNSNTEKYTSDLYPSLIRLPAGTLSNYTDWRTGYPIYERDLPFNWFYDKRSYTLNMNREGNQHTNIRDNLNFHASRPIIALNLLTSKFHFELASLYSLNAVNLPVRYIELGNEFYLSDENYKERFPSVDDYMNEAIKWAESIKDIFPFQNTKIAVVGATGIESAEGRRNRWMDQVLKRLHGTAVVEAVTIHDYLRLNDNSTSCTGSLQPAGIEDFLVEPFLHVDDIVTKEVVMVRNHNAQATKPLEIWLTEYNLDADKDVRTGTWPHALLNLSLALRFLESPEITNIISHTLISWGKFGNLFDSDNAFDDVKCHGLPCPCIANGTNGKPQTREKQKSAIGHSHEALAAVLRGAVEGTPLDFPGSGVLGSNSSSAYQDLYGWQFVDANNNISFIIINLSSSAYDVSLTAINAQITNLNYNAYSLQANNNAFVILGDPGFNPSGPGELIKNNDPWTLSSLSILKDKLRLSPFSLCVVTRKPDLQTNILRLTDNEICTGTTTTLVIDRYDGSSSPIITPTSGVTLTLINSLSNSERQVYEVEANVAGAYTISPCSTCPGLQLVVNQNFSTPSITTTGYSGQHCAGSASNIVLTASAVTPNFNYSYIWVPDTGVASNNNCPNPPFVTCQSINVNPDRTTLYTVYVTDGACWQSAQQLIEVPLSRVSLGDPFAVCPNTTLQLISNIDNPSFSYAWSNGSTTSSINVTILTPQTFTLTITEPTSGCSVITSVDIDALECCTNSAGVVMNPELVANDLLPVDEVFSYPKKLADACSLVGGYSVSPPSNGNALFVIDCSSIGNPITINGLFKVINKIDQPAVIQGGDLKLIGCSLDLGPKARIEIEPNRKLILEACTLRACGSSMWETIIAENKGVTNPPEIICSSSVISNAEIAIQGWRNSKIELSNCTFENNNIDLSLNRYTSGMNSGTIIVENNTFTSDPANGLLPPFAGKTKWSGISLNDVSAAPVGANSNGNNFSHSVYGIYSLNSGLKALNNTFAQHFNVQSPKMGAGVYSQSAFDFNERSTQIGNGALNGGNNFLSSRDGIFSLGEMSWNIRGNIFGAADVSQRIWNNCIYIANSGLAEIEIGTNSSPGASNEFYNYTYGVNILNPGNSKPLLVGNNDFYNGIYSNPGNSIVNFEGSAILLRATQPTPLPLSTITFNEIGTNASEGPRLGMVLSLVNEVDVNDNSILINKDAPGGVFKGIWAMGCDELRLKRNEVSNVQSSSGFNASFIGLDLSQSNNTCIEENQLNNCGYGMRFTGNTIVQSLFSNVLNNFDEGIHLNNADIGPTVGTEDPANPGNGNVMGNEWILCSGCPPISKIVGSLFSPLTWYTDASPGDPTFPDNNNVLLLLPFPINSTSQQSECQLSVSIEDETDFGNTLTLKKRNETYGAVVADTARYPEEYSQEFRYLAREAVFKILRKHPGLMMRDDESDTSFVNFYTTMMGGNAYLIDSLQTLINNRHFVEADTLLARLTEVNEQEYNYKKVYAATILWMVDGEEAIDELIRDELNVIAHQHPLLGGYAVYVARNLLQLEMHDELPSNSRVMAQKETTSQRMMNVYPNPANEYVEISFTDRAIPEKVILRDLTGRICSSLLNSAIVNTTILLPGIYFIEVIVKGEKHNANIVVAR